MKVETRRRNAMRVVRVILAFAMVQAGCYTVLAANADFNKDGAAILQNCSLGLEMTADGYFEKVAKNKKPLPSSLEQNMATQCVAYIVGFKDAFYVQKLYQEKNGQKPTVCVPDELDNRTAIKTTVQYIANNTNLLNKPGQAAVFNAFYYVYPCK